MVSLKCFESRHLLPIMLSAVFVLYALWKSYKTSRYMVKPLCRVNENILNHFTKNILFHKKRNLQHKIILRASRNWKSFECKWWMPFIDIWGVERAEFSNDTRFERKIALKRAPNLLRYFAIYFDRPANL